MLLLAITSTLQRSTVTLNLTTAATNNTNTSLQNPELRLAFGSCYGIFDYKSDIFRVISLNNPHLWIWLGDAAYTDYVPLAGCKLLKKI